MGQEGGSSNSSSPWNWVEIEPGIAHVLCDPCSPFQFQHPSQRVASAILPSTCRHSVSPVQVMNFCTTLSSPPSVQVLRHAETVLQAWGLQFKVSETIVCRLVRCFDSAFLLSLPRPPGFKVGTFSPPQIHRYLWYRQAAKALGWRDRQKISAEIEDLLKVHVWPDEAAESCNGGSAVECRQTVYSGSDPHARKGSSGKERQGIIGAGSKSREALGPNQTILRANANAGPDTAESGILDTWRRGGKRARECSTAPVDEADGEECTPQTGTADDCGRGWDSKRARGQPELPREST